MKRIEPFIDTDLIKVLTGMRRCGKSVMLQLIGQELLRRGVHSEQILSLNFEDMDNRKLCTAEALHAWVAGQMENTAGRVYLFFDEIQEVSDWQICLNSLRVKYDCDIYITGSNAHLLSGELATYLGGRYAEFVICPFSFAEFTDLYKEAKGEADPAQVFRAYMAFGGMPFLLNLGLASEPSRQYLRDVYNSVVLKDIVRRHSIRDVDLLERIILYVLANVGHPFSATSISKYFKNEGRCAQPETILNYLNACAQAYLFYPVRRQDLIGKKILSVNEKYYVADHGLREAVYGKNTRDIELVLENIVFMELFRRGFHVTVGKLGAAEVDFVAERNGERVYIQVCYLLATQDTLDREFGLLAKIKDNYPKLVLSLDEFDMGREGIQHRNIRTFLKEEV
jgi:predicted AAA+ superfamily ATPase